MSQKSYNLNEHTQHSVRYGHKISIKPYLTSVSESYFNCQSKDELHVGHFEILHLFTEHSPTILHNRISITIVG